MTYKALVIEDDPEVLSAIEEVLDSIGHQFDVVTNLADALKHCATGQYAYVLSDMEIHAKPRLGKPRVQNIENLLERLAETSNGECLPIILMTDLTAPDNPLLVKMMRLAANLCERGVCEFIGKPFLSEGRTLDRVIKKILGLCVAPPPQARGRGKKAMMVASAVGDSGFGGQQAGKSEGVAAVRDCTLPEEPSVLTKIQRDVLESLAESPHETMLLGTVVEASGYSRHAVRESLDRLRDLGLACRPQGERKGDALTAKGRALLEELLT